MTANEDERRIAQRIIELCEAAFGEGKPYVLLSRLGLDLGEDVKNIKYMTGRGLAEFVRKCELLREYSLVQVGTTTNILAIVKASAAQGGQTESLAVPASQSAPEARYHYRFWAAFSVPWSHGTRYLDLANFVFKDLDGDVAPAGWVKIEQEFIAPKEAEKRDQLIKGNIERWLVSHDMERDRFLQNAKPSVSVERSLLSALIDSLDRRQLQSTVLPLDVIASLFNKKL